MVKCCFSSLCTPAGPVCPCWMLPRVEYYQRNKLACSPPLYLWLSVLIQPTQIPFYFCSQYICPLPPKVLKQYRIQDMYLAQVLPFSLIKSLVAACFSLLSRGKSPKILWRYLAGEILSKSCWLTIQFLKTLISLYPHHSVSGILFPLCQCQ